MAATRGSDLPTGIAKVDGNGTKTIVPCDLVVGKEASLTTMETKIACIFGATLAAPGMTWGVDTV